MTTGGHNRNKLYEFKTVCLVHSDNDLGGVFMPPRRNAPYSLSWHYAGVVITTGGHNRAGKNLKLSGGLVLYFPPRPFQMSLAEVEAPAETTTSHQDCRFNDSRRTKPIDVCRLL
jgi:hypothetical protein